MPKSKNKANAQAKPKAELVVVEDSEENPLENSQPVSELGADWVEAEMPEVFEEIKQMGRDEVEDGETEEETTEEVAQRTKESEEMKALKETVSKLEAKVNREADAEEVPDIPSSGSEDATDAQMKKWAIDAAKKNRRVKLNQGAA